MRENRNGEGFRCNTFTVGDKGQTLNTLTSLDWLNVNMSATRYRRFLKLCEEWPRDDYKKGRDLGTFLRQRVALAFREGENTQVSQRFGALAT